jgi:uncharacterized protein DUF5681
MAKAGRSSYEIGYRKPPRQTQFQPGRSGNLKGRPRGAKNFAVAIDQELGATVIVTENGRRRKLSKREVIAKRVVNRAAEGDLKAVPLLMQTEVRLQENLQTVSAEQIFGRPAQQPVIDGIVQRILAAAAASASAVQDSPVQDPGEKDGNGEE